MKSYIHITPDVRFLNFKVASDKGVQIEIERRGGGESLSVDPFEVNDCKARFPVDEPGFGLCEGWYTITLYVNECPCKIYVARVYEPCGGAFTGAEELIFNPDNFCE